MTELGWVCGCSLAPGEVGVEVGLLASALQVPFAPQEDCEFYLMAQRFIVLPMERQRIESSDGYVPRWVGGSALGVGGGGFLIFPERR